MSKNIKLVKEERKEINVLALKKQIATCFNEEKITKKELSNKFNVSYQFVRSAIDLSGTLVNLDPNDSAMFKKYVTKNASNKYVQIDSYIIDRLSKLRQKRLCNSEENYKINW